MTTGSATVAASGEELWIGLRVRVSLGFGIAGLHVKHTGLFRFANSRNSKSGLCAIPLTAREIFTLTIDEIKSLAKEPREIEYFPVEELAPNEELVKLIEKVFSESVKFTANLNKVELDENDPIWLGVADGKRNESLAKIVGYFIAKRIDNEIVISIVKKWNSNCKPPEDEKIVVQHTLSLIRDYGSAHTGFCSIGQDGKVNFSLVEFRKFLEAAGFAKAYPTKDYTGAAVSVRRDRAARRARHPRR